MEKIKAWIVDDEIDARSLIRGLVDEYCPNIEIIGESIDIDGAWDKLRKEKPQLVYLDINMPRGSGLDLLLRFPIRKFEVIVISAYADNEQELHNTKDIAFLQKPYSIDEFLKLSKEAVDRIQQNPNKIYRSVH